MEHPGADVVEARQVGIIVFRMEAPQHVGARDEPRIEILELDRVVGEQALSRHFRARQRSGHFDPSVDL